MTGVSSPKIQRIITMLIVILDSVCIVAVGETIHVDISGQADFGNIQAGIDAAVNGDTVLVASGEYIVTEPITFRGKAITVISEAGSDETIIRMGTPSDPKRSSVVIFENGETTESVLDGFTITGGTGCRLWVSEESKFVLSGGGIVFNASSGTVRNCSIMKNGVIDAGGGVGIGSGSSVTFTNCMISGNTSTSDVGGGVVVGYRSSATLTNCIIMDNSASKSGGGACCWHGSLTLTDCLIMSNTATKCGGGLYVGHGSAILTNCLIAQNKGLLWGGGGVMSSYRNASLSIHNCTIWGNSAGFSCPPGNELWGGGGVLCRYAYATVSNSIVWGNTSPVGAEISVRDSASTFTVAYSNIGGGQAGASVESGCILDWDSGNIDVDPYFVDPENGDFHLKSQAGRWDPNSQSWIQDDVTSPCIDAGDPDSDWKVELWPHGIRTNMGAYGSTLQASRSLSDAGNIADLNRDTVVDSADICMMVDHWYTDEPYCDIAPAPFGDGIIDVQDMAILGENLFEDYRLDLVPMIAYWKLDETEGDIAYDSAGDNYGTLSGNPTWQPDGGQVAGALQFDGIDDYVSTSSVLNPKLVEFSVFAWIKGGSPGQVIISQKSGFGGSGATWLGTDAPDGRLITELSSTTVGPLESEFVIADDEWHHIGFVWDGSHRQLYVDGTQVVKDTVALTALKPSTGGMYIGVAKDRTPASFFSGLIDDVRIYYVALTTEEIAAFTQ